MRSELKENFLWLAWHADCRGPTYNYQIKAS
uniref:Uncharacterized protein n=1 Tax=Arundo donax TaxID=35708 RepID=A0A0A9FWD4_ARUDO